jgi:HEAT repeat protein
VVEALGRIGPDAGPAVTHLMPRFIKQGCNLAKQGTFLESTYGNPRYALARIGAPAVPALVDLLNGPNQEMRPCAAYVLAEIGPPAKEAVPSLIRALRLEQPVLDFQDLQSQALRYHAIVALGQIGPPASAAIPALNMLLGRKGKYGVFEDSDVIVEALGKIGVPPIAKLLDVFLREAKSGAAYDLSRLGPKAKAAIPSLRGALTDQRLQVRIDAAVALVFIAPPAPEAVPVLIDALEHHPEEGYQVPEALGRLGPDAKAALPTLIGLVRGGTPGSGDVEALAQVDPEGKVCVPALVTALGDKDPSVSDAAARALGLLGPAASEAIPALAATLKRDFMQPFENEGSPLVAAAKALGRIGPDARSAIPALIRALQVRHFVPAGGDLGMEQDQVDYKAAIAAAQVLGSFGPEAKASVPTLIDVLRAREKDDDNWEVRREAALALGRIGPDATAAVPVLRKVLEEGPPATSWGMDRLPAQVSDAAVIALFHLAPDGKGLAEKWVEKSVAPVRRAFVLGAMGKRSLEGELIARRWLEDLNGVLEQGERESSETLFVEGYFERLSDLGVGAEPAVPRLNELCNHRNPWIRQWAGEALRRIMPAAGASKVSDPKSK